MGGTPWGGGRESLLICLPCCTSLIMLSRLCSELHKRPGSTPRSCMQSIGRADISLATLPPCCPAPRNGVGSRNWKREGEIRAPIPDNSRSNGRSCSQEGARGLYMACRLSVGQTPTISHRLPKQKYSFQGYRLEKDLKGR